MTFIVLGVCLFVGFVFLFLMLTPRPSAAGALLQEVTRPMRPADGPAWRGALDVDYLAKPFTLIRRLFTPEPAPNLVRRLMLAGYRKPAHADIFLGSRLAIPATLGLLAALFIGNNVILWFLISVGVGFYVPDFWLSWATNKRRDRIRMSLPDGLDFLAICLEAGLGLVTAADQFRTASGRGANCGLEGLRRSSGSGEHSFVCGNADSDRQVRDADFQVSGRIFGRIAHTATAAGGRNGGEDDHQIAVSVGALYCTGDGNRADWTRVHFTRATFSAHVSVGL